MTTALTGGLRTRMESLDMLANNMANSSTVGFKVDREFYSVYSDAEAQPGDGGLGESVLPLVEKPWTDYTQGTLQHTGNALDFAIQGKGFFAVSSPGGPLYTRSGSFELAKDGKVTTAEGYPVQLADGKPLVLTPGQTFELGQDGVITQAGAPIGKLRIVNPPEQGFVKQGATLYALPDPKLLPSASTDARVHQGKLEASNVSAPETAIRLVNLMRQFESLQKAVSIGTEMNRRALEEVAKVAS